MKRLIVSLVLVTTNSVFASTLKCVGSVNIRDGAHNEAVLQDGTAVVGDYLFQIQDGSEGMIMLSAGGFQNGKSSRATTYAGIPTAHDKGARLVVDTSEGYLLLECGHN